MGENRFSPIYFKLDSSAWARSLSEVFPNLKRRCGSALHRRSDSGTNSWLVQHKINGSKHFFIHSLIFISSWTLFPSARSVPHAELPMWGCSPMPIWISEHRLASATPKHDFRCDCGWEVQTQHLPGIFSSSLACILITY